MCNKDTTIVIVFCAIAISRFLVKFIERLLNIIVLRGRIDLVQGWRNRSCNADVHKFPQKVELSNYVGKLLEFTQFLSRWIGDIAWNVYLHRSRGWSAVSSSLEPSPPTGHYCLVPYSVTNCFIKLKSHNPYCCDDPTPLPHSVHFASLPHVPRKRVWPRVARPCNFSLSLCALLNYTVIFYTIFSIVARVRVPFDSSNSCVLFVPLTRFGYLFEVRIRRFFFPSQKERSIDTISISCHFWARIRWTSHLLARCSKQTRV